MWERSWGCPAQRPVRQVHGRGKALKKRDSSWLCRDPHAKASYAEGGEAVPKVPACMCWSEGTSCLATGLRELGRGHRRAEWEGQVGNEVFKLVFCGVCASAGPPACCQQVSSVVSQHSPSGRCPPCQEVWMAWIRRGFLTLTQR